MQIQHRIVGISGNGGPKKHLVSCWPRNANETGEKTPGHLLEIHDVKNQLDSILVARANPFLECKRVAIPHRPVRDNCV